METVDVCMAPDCKETRARNHHCLVHANIFKPKYLQYKTLQSKLSRLDNLDQLSIADLLQRYNAYSRVYKLRRSCMRKYFKLEHWDAGHTLMTVNIWSDLVKIERWIAKRVSIQAQLINVTKVEEEDEEQVTEITEPEEVLKIQKKFAIWESLNNPQSCLAKQYQIEMMTRDKLFNGIMSWARIQIKPSNIEANIIDKYIETAIIVTMQACNIMNEELQYQNKVAYSYSPQVHRDYSSCCLKTFFTGIVSDQSMTNMFVFLVSRLIYFLSEEGILPQISFPRNWKLNVQDSIEILTNQGVMMYDETKHKDYFCIKFTYKRHTKREQMFKLPVSVKSMEEWISNPKAKYDRRGECDNSYVCGNNPAKIYICCLIETSFIRPMKLRHICGINECSYCLQEIEKEEEWGSLHPK